jgi:hypothetical protein
VSRWLYVTNLASFHLRLSAFLRTHLFAPYIGALMEAKSEVSPLLHQVQIGKTIRDPVARSSWRKALYIGRKIYETARSIVDQDYILLFNKKIS